MVEDKDLTESATVSNDVVGWEDVSDRRLGISWHLLFKVAPFLNDLNAREDMIDCGLWFP